MYHQLMSSRDEAVGCSSHLVPLSLPAQGQCEVRSVFLMCVTIAKADHAREYERLIAMNYTDEITFTFFCHPRIPSCFI